MLWGEKVDVYPNTFAATCTTVGWRLETGKGEMAGQSNNGAQRHARGHHSSGGQAKTGSAGIRPGAGAVGDGRLERHKDKEDESEGLCFGDSVTLFAEKMFGFLQGASSNADEDDDDESSVYVRSLEHRHRPSG